MLGSGSSLRSRYRISGLRGSCGRVARREGPAAEGCRLIGQMCSGLGRSLKGKLCFVVQNSLGRGPAARPRSIPPALALRSASSRIRAIKTYRRSSLAGLGDVPLHLHRTMHDRLPGQSALGKEPPSSPKTPMAISWRPGKERTRRCPSMGPTHRPKTLRGLWTPDQPCADWMRAILPKMDHGGVGCPAEVVIGENYQVR